MATEITYDESETSILWTGGWDSTFRLLELVLVQQRRVQPHYLVITARPSTQTDLETTDVIRREVAKVDPSGAALIGETILTPIEKVPAIPQITERFQRLRNCRHIGSQYEMLARFAASRDLYGLELSIHRDDIAHSFLVDNVYHEGDYYRLVEHPTDEELRLFERFRFPIFDLTKLEMQRRAEKYGFAAIMEFTWFCHFPRRDQPCGTCMPCRFAMEEGMGRRIPFKNRLRYHLGVAKRRAKELIRGLPLGINNRKFR